MNLLETMIAMACMSVMGLVLSTSVYYQQDLWHKTHTYIHEVYALLLTLQQLQTVADELEAVVCALPVQWRAQAIQFQQINLLSQQEHAMSYYALLTDIQWYETTSIHYHFCRVGIQLLITNLQELQVLSVDSCENMPILLSVHMSPPLMVLALQRKTLDFHPQGTTVDLRLHDRGVPQVLVSGFKWIHFKILAPSLLQWDFQLPLLPHFSWKQSLCKV